MKVEENKNEKEDLNQEDPQVEENLEEEFAQEEEIILEEATEKLQKEYDDLLDKFTRLQADFANFKRRSTEEKTNYLNLGLERLALDILPVLDNFERALEMVDDRESPFFEGMEMLEKQFIEILTKNKVIEIQAEGQVFDPNFHHAVMTEAVEGVESGLVTSVLQKGYVHGEKVIRPAMVKVSE